jgi:hypothetical protein
VPAHLSEPIEQKTCTAPSMMAATTTRTAATTGTATTARAFRGLPILGETADLTSAAAGSIVGPSVRPARPSRLFACDGSAALGAGEGVRRATAAIIDAARSRAMANVYVTIRP